MLGEGADGAIIALRFVLPRTPPTPALPPSRGKGATGAPAPALLYMAPTMNAPLRTLPFVKMNGLGNDFAVVQAPLHGFSPTPQQVRAWADRERGIGFDQLIALSDDGGEAPLVRFW